MVKYVMKTKKEQHPSRIWNAALYLRLSRDDDKYESESISSQRELLLNFINSNSDMKVQRYKNITELSREVVSALIDNIYVYEDNRIEIVMKYRDEYEAVMDYVCATDRIEITLRFADEIGETLKLISESMEEGASKQRTAI